MPYEEENGLESEPPMVVPTLLRLTPTDIGVRPRKHMTLSKIYQPTSSPGAEKNLPNLVAIDGTVPGATTTTIVESEFTTPRSVKVHAEEGDTEPAPTTRTS